MTRIIRGFSPSTSYSCLQCHLKCCATEYNLPLFPQESQVLRQNYPFCDMFILSLEESDWLLRGDCCPFLNSEGLCLLHKTPNKPLMCQIYPLILWKVKPDLILAWINPCRGNSFQWVSKPENRIPDRQIDILVEKSRSKFNNYLGEQIDKENPFTNISVNRINEELIFFETVNKDDLITKIENINSFTKSLNVIHPLRRKLSEIPSMKDLVATMNAVIHWLSWSPVGLQLTFTNSKLVFLVAATWIEYYGRSILSQPNLPLNHDQILQQIGSSLATAILPSFWKQIALKTNFEGLGKFATKVFRVLNGEISQEELALLNS